MRRIAFLLPTLVAAFAPAAADASPKARALLLGCAQGLVPMDRSAVFEGEMRAQPGTARMQMRFHLRTRASRHPRWGRIGASGLGEWVTSDPGMTHYVFTKRVENLSAPASYRMIIHFRWLDAVGGILAREVAVTRRCRQPDLRPNVRPLSQVLNSMGLLFHVGLATLFAARHTTAGWPEHSSGAHLCCRPSRDLLSQLLQRITPGEFGLFSKRAVRAWPRSA